MCVANDSFEQGSQSIVDQMIRETAYKITGFEINGKLVENSSTALIKPSDMISGVLLVDKAGASHLIKPGIPGIRYTRGDITYDEYVRLQKRADRLGFGIFGAAVCILVAVGILLVNVYL
ncbi:hypothetical protein [Bacillus sp. EB01]|uniref:hypothetical protein n=1 Tax=Bacillus sp. EB01 TaxID=1347086 RepID=UPI0005C6999A|nr:hypothetical protein [Bacillus sp. EB01]